LNDLMSKWRAEFGDDDDKTMLVRYFSLLIFCNQF